MGEYVGIGSRKAFWLGGLWIAVYHCHDWMDGVLS
jgi:hypothetical protein